MRRKFSTGLVLVAAVAALAVVPQADAQQQSRRTPVVEVFEQCRDAVVNISTTKLVQIRSIGFPSIWDDVFDFGPRRQRNRRVQSVGSGLVVHESGYIVTNAHVVSQASDVQVIFADKTKLPAEIVAADSEHDLAVLKIKAPRPLPALELGHSDDLMIGETVIAIGNPLGLQHTVTAGIVSALNRDLHFSRDVVYRGLIQTDASINPGNSGGPLLNVNGKLIGINTALRGDAQNIGFAIPVDRLWALLPRLLDIERRQRVRFGLEVSGSDAQVVAVQAGSPAEKAGLKPGDRVVQFNGEALQDGIDYYVRLLEQTPGNKIQLAVARGGKTVQASVPLQAVPPPDGQKLARQQLGVKLTEIPEELHRELELPEHVGLIVEKVDRRSPADRAGFEPGDIILRLERVTVSTLPDVGLALEPIRPGETVIIDGLRLRADPPFYWNVAVRTRGR